ncbi:hypothetical protein M1N56_08400 [Dehalococcoidia bacterium]|nr:hypothetical protein [Dehalococcoidia bacterium]
MTSHKDVLIAAPDTDYNRKLAGPDLNIEIRNEEVTYRSEDNFLDSAESSELIRRTRRKRLVFDFLSIAVMVVLIPGISLEVWSRTNSSSLNFATAFIPIVSMGFWALVFLFSDQWFKTRIVFSVAEGSAQNYWRYRYGLTRLFGARRVQQVLHRQKLPREFKYNFNVGESIYSEEVQYSKARSIDLELNIEAQAIEKNPNTIGEFIKGFTRSSRPARRISPPRMFFRIAFAAVMVYCGWLVIWEGLPWLTVLSLLGLAFVFQWSSLRNRETMKDGFLANHSKLKWVVIGILVFLTFSVSIGVFESIGLAGVVIDDLNPIPFILIGILGLWFYSEIYSQRAWFILPNGIYESMSCNFYRYEEMIDSSKLTYSEFLQGQPVPSDASVVGFVWEHQNLDGGPDLRFKSNYQQANLQMAYVSLASETGLDLILQVSDWYKAAEFAGFWTSSEFDLTADYYLLCMLISCANTIDVISDTTGLDKDQFLALQRKDFILDSTTLTLPEGISSATLEIAAHMGLPREQNGILDSLISQLGSRLSYPDELSIEGNPSIAPDIDQAPTLVFSNEKLKLKRSSSAKNTLGDIPSKPNWRPGKLTWVAGSVALILASTVISVMIMAPVY